MAIEKIGRKRNDQKMLSKLYIEEKTIKMKLEKKIYIFQYFMNKQMFVLKRTFILILFLEFDVRSLSLPILFFFI